MSNVLIEVQKTGNESNANLLRRFSRKIKGAGYVIQAKSLKYNQRKQSEFKKKQETLKKLRKREVIARLKKLGKIKDGYRK